MSANPCIAFIGVEQLAIGTLADVAAAVKRAMERDHHRPILIFDTRTSDLLEVDTRGSAEEAAHRYASDGHTEAPADETLENPLAPGTPRARGRPRLGVVAREVTLLPRHWEWLGSQPGGASVALRKLVEEARRANAGRDAARQSREASYKFMSVMAGNLETFEEATRALFAGDRPRFEAMIASWPADVRTHVTMLARPSFG